MTESLFLFIDKVASTFDGFLLVGVFLILFGIRDITARDWEEYKKTHTNTSKRDEVLAWGFFYIIFGTLIFLAAIVALLPLL